MTTFPELAAFCGAAADVGYLFAADGRTHLDMLETLARELGRPLTAAEQDAVTAGYDEGRRGRNR